MLGIIGAWIILLHGMKLFEFSTLISQNLKKIVVFYPIFLGLIIYLNFSNFRFYCSKGKLATFKIVFNPIASELWNGMSVSNFHSGTRNVLIVILFFQGFKILCSIVFDIEITLESFYKLNPLTSSTEPEKTNKTRVEQLIGSIFLDIIILLVFSQAIISTLYSKKSNLHP